MLIEHQWKLPASHPQLCDMKK